MNVCELSSFFSFFPVCFVYPLYKMIVGHKRDLFIIIMLIIAAFLFVWCTKGMPYTLAKITLLSNSQSGRSVVALECICMLLIFRSVCIWCSENNSIIVGLIVSISAAVLIVLRLYKLAPEYYETYMIVTEIVILILIFWGIWHLNNTYVKNMWMILMVGVALVSGLLVNPVRRGADDVKSISQLNMVREIHESDPDALWVFANKTFPSTNAPLLVGAPTVNSTNVYPDLERWHVLDKDGRYESVYNRYAHIVIELVDGHDEVDLFDEPIRDDLIKMNATADDLRNIDVKYIFTPDGTLDSSKYKMLDSDNGYYVYSVISE